MIALLAAAAIGWPPPVSSWARVQAALRNIPSVAGGSEMHGENVAFTLNLEPGSAVKFECPHYLMPELVNSLMMFAQLAENDRRGRPAGAAPTDILKPYDSVRTPRLGRGPDGEVFIQFATTQGPPIAVSMPLDQAQALSDILVRALATAPSKSRPH